VGSSQVGSTSSWIVLAPYKSNRR